MVATLLRTDGRTGGNARLIFLAWPTLPFPRRRCRYALEGCCVLSRRIETALTLSRSDHTQSTIDWLALNQSILSRTPCVPTILSLTQVASSADELLGAGPSIPLHLFRSFFEPYGVGVFLFVCLFLFSFWFVFFFRRGRVERESAEDEESGHVAGGASGQQHQRGPAYPRGDAEEDNARKVSERGRHLSGRGFVIDAAVFENAPFSW